MDLSATGPHRSQQGEGDSKHASKQPIPLVGVKRPVDLSYLRENKVPKAVVLRPRPAGAGPLARPGRQNKVVAHFLGLSTPDHVADASTAAWGAVDMVSLRPYRRDCHDVVAACRGKVGREDWVDLLRAIDEASMVLEDGTVASMELLRSVPEEKQPMGSAKKASNKSTPLQGKASMVATDVGTANNDDNKDDDNENEDEAGLGQTPEFYDDWKGAESQSQRNTQFSQVFNFSQAQSYGEQEAAIEEKTEATSTSSADVASVESDDDKKNASAGADSPKNGDGDEISVATVKTTNVAGSGDKGIVVENSKSNNEKEKDPTPSIAKEDTTIVDTTVPPATTKAASISTTNVEEAESPRTATEKEPTAAVGPTEVTQKQNGDESGELEEQKGDEQKNKEGEEEEDQAVVSQEETKAEGADRAEAEAEAESEKITISNTIENTSTELSDDEELSDYGPESQDISDMDTQQHSNLTDPACIISPKDGAPMNSKRRDLASILGHKKTKKTMVTTTCTATPFVSSKGSTKKVSPSPVADAAANGDSTGSVKGNDEDIDDEGLESKRLFEGNANISEKRTIESVGCEERDVNAKKPRGGDEAYFSAEELEDEDMHFFTQQG